MPDNEFYRVRLLSAAGFYPSKPLVVGDFAALAVDGVAWSAVHDPRYPEDNGPGELARLSPDEIRFFGALSLAEPHPRTNGRLRIVPGLRTRSIEVKARTDHADPSQLIERARVAVTELLTERVDYRSESTYSSPELVERDYTEATLQLLQAMDPADPLLHRGLYKLLVATELMLYAQFLEEAALSAFVAREAALELLRRKLEVASGGRLNKADVLEQIRATFPTGRQFVEVLETDWEARIIMVHPVSKFGEFWTPPVLAQECFDALHTLTYLFRYLLLDEVWQPAEWD